MLYKGSTSTNILITEKMGTAAPLAIGTRGTVGSLVRREIEYFRRLDLDHGETSKKPKSKNYIGISNNNNNNNNNNTNTNTTSYSTSRMKAASLGSLLNINWRKKKRRSSSSSNSNNSTILPSMCSAVDVSESKRFAGLNYRNLKADIEP